MAATTQPPASPRVRFWHRRRNRRLMVQAGFLVLVAALLLYLWGRAQSLQLGFGFLDGSAGFAIGHQFLTEYSSRDSRVDAYVTGVWNTIRVVLVGITLATLIGVTAGVARLSGNWLVSRLALVYVETIRNTPLLVQIIFWYTAVLLQLPPIGEGSDLLGVVYLSNRALAVPWAWPDGGSTAIWAAVLVLCALAAWFVRRSRVAYENRTGRPGHAMSAAIATFVLLAVATFVLLGAPLRLEISEVALTGTTQQYAGGMQVTPEFAALLFGLAIYTGAFIAEIVRGSIQSLPYGQSEAAAALGLSSYERTTLIILPQALRTMIPPLTNQYLNLTKNSSLAVVIGYADLVFVGNTLINSFGHAVPMFAIIMATYLGMSAVVATLMNAFNRRVQSVRI